MGNASSLFGYGDGGTPPAFPGGVSSSHTVFSGGAPAPNKPAVMGDASKLFGGGGGGTGGDGAELFARNDLSNVNVMSTAPKLAVIADATGLFGSSGPGSSLFGASTAPAPAPAPAPARSGGAVQDASTLFGNSQSTPTDNLFGNTKVAFVITPAATNASMLKVPTAASLFANTPAGSDLFGQYNQASHNTSKCSHCQLADNAVTSTSSFTLRIDDGDVTGVLVVDDLWHRYPPLMCRRLAFQTFSYAS